MAKRKRDVGSGRAFLFKRKLNDAIGGRSKKDRHADKKGGISRISKDV